MHQNPALTRELIDLRQADLRRGARSRRSTDALRVRTLRLSRPRVRFLGH